MPVESYCYYKIAASDLKTYTMAARELEAIPKQWTSLFTFKRRVIEQDPVTCMEIGIFESLDDYNAWQNERARYFEKINTLIIGGPDAIRYELFTDL